MNFNKFNEKKINLINDMEMTKPTNKSTKTEMVAYAKSINLKNYSKMNKGELAAALEIKGHIKGVKKAGKKDVNKPKRAKTAYIFFCQDRRKALVKKNPEASFGEIGSLLGKEWASLTNKEKEKYTKANQKDKERYKKEMEKYNMKEEAPEEEAPEEKEEAPKVLKKPVKKTAKKPVKKAKKMEFEEEVEENSEYSESEEDSPQVVRKGKKN